MIVNKKVKLSLIGVDANIYRVFSAFSKQAKCDGWTKEEIGRVVNRAKDGSYKHAANTIMEHCEDPDELENPSVEFENSYVDYVHVKVLESLDERGPLSHMYWVIPDGWVAKLPDIPYGRKVGIVTTFATEPLDVEEIPVASLRWRYIQTFDLVGPVVRAFEKVEGERV